MPVKTARLAVSAVGLCLLFFVQAVAARTSSESCEIPEGLKDVIASKYPEARLVDLTDLSEDDKARFRKEHGESCPGLVKVDFYGDGQPTFALALTTKSKATPETHLVLAHLAGTNWKVAALDTANGGPIPVVWSEKPGDYKDVYGEKKIHATKPVVVFCGYSSWAVLYAWTNNRIAKIWLAD